MLNFSQVQPADAPIGYRVKRAATVVEVRPDGLTQVEYKILHLITGVARSKESIPPLAIMGERFQKSTAWVLNQINSLESLGKVRCVGVGRSRQVEVLGLGLRTAPDSWVWRNMDAMAK